MELALFDFDGTITFGDTFKPFLYFAGRAPRIIAGTLLLSPMIAGYELGLVPASQMRVAAARVAFAGRSERDILDLGRRYATSLNRRVRPEALARIRWHQERGHEIVVVSASLDVYLRAWCEQLNLPLICTQLEASAGILTGRYENGDCTGREKAKRVQSKYDLTSYSTIYAYGDTAEDTELLGLANKRFFRWQELT